VVLDSTGRLPLESALVQTARATPTLLATTARIGERRALYEAHGVEVLVLGERVQVADLLDELGRRRFTNVLVEGGGEVLGNILDAGEVDEVHVFIAPRLAGGALARTPMAGVGVETIAQAPRLTEWSFRDVEGDLYVHGRCGPA
jgi:diaminohydroxyphosphoribosylaminopyrimidine deaminase/5-amino-6-(5-phosphoribosylamino)uracil reductase